MTVTTKSKRFCSKICCRRAWVKKNPEKIKAAQIKHNDRRRLTPTYEKTCEWCGKQFIATRKDKRACSRTCKNAYWSKQIKRYKRHGCDWNDEFARLWQAQDGKCYLCEGPLGPDQADCHVDHDHSCCPSGRSCEKCRRGLAHPLCNWIVGYAGDDPDRLRRIADNLEAANTRLRETKDRIR